MVQDVTTAALHASLRGLSTRRRVIADNIANIDTPGYLAGRVNFEATLNNALDGARRGRLDAPTVNATLAERQTSIEATRLNGNNVNLDDEMMLQEQTELAYSTILEATSAKFRLLRSAISGQA